MASDKIYVHTNITITIPSALLDSSSFRQRTQKHKNHLLYLSQLLILRSSDTELNPGPRAVKFPCGVCSKGCFWRQRAICCDSYEIWYHAKCLGMKDEVYEPYTRSDETFTCFNCGIPNFSSGLFDTVLGEPAQLQTTGESHSSIKSSDVPESSSSSASCNISDISSIHNSTLESDSSFFDQENRVPRCSSPSKKTPKKVAYKQCQALLIKHTVCYER